MQIEITELDPDTNHVLLTGPLDAAAACASELQFTAAMGAAGRNVLIDMSGVPFVASLGIRMLISSARVLDRRGRRMVLFSIRPEVMEVFDTIALSSVVPIAPDEAGARAMLPG